ncbi:hypothetical protein C882_2049 [Caenispirillum salinarum AK4]|uniref:Uncharacterized protein n=1 Tax=Caenispirillum salinarum AK4 TaxID=1238182 RepID=K9GMA1_9PROT|nr:hypothetical protein [Caenispirillum salinarum]EKV27120.1 hypothetical protein C882_2049 [Caenispirillum salinarum AK4]
MTAELLDRLHLVPGSVARLMDAPDDWSRRLPAMAAEGVTWVGGGPCSWLLAFASDRAALQALVPRAVPVLAEDAVFWVAHPRGSHSDLTREKGWQPLIAEGFGATECVPLDERWQALRFTHQHDTHLRHGGVSRP